jgi:hypothetical protein
VVSPSYTNGNLNAGTYVTHCSGAVDGNYTYNYVDGSFTVTTVTLNVTAPSATFAYGTATPSLAPNYSGFVNGDSSSALTTQATCVVVSPSYTNGNLNAGTYVTHCSGAVDGNYTYNYVDGSFTVTTVILTITAASPPTISFGNSTPTITPSFSGFVNGDGPASLSGLNCTIDSAAFNAGFLNAGTYVTSCQNATDGNYAISYVNGSLTVNQVGTSILYTGDQFLFIGNNYNPSSTLSSAVNACYASQPVSYIFDVNPTGGTGQFSINTTTGSGGASSASVSTAGWFDGVYTVTVSYLGTSNCVGSTTLATVAIVAAGDAATGGGWFTLPNVGRMNFGFTVHKVPNTTNTYKGQIVVVSGSWRFKGTLTTYGTTTSGTTVTGGVAIGTGDLYWWNSALNSGTGGWQLQQSGVSFTASFTPSTSGKKGAPGTFGIEINYTSPYPLSPLPNSAPLSLKGGNVNVS